MNSSAVSQQLPPRDDTGVKPIEVECQGLHSTEVLTFESRRLIQTALVPNRDREVWLLRAVKYNNKAIKTTIHIKA
jgi:hypothetical protein